MSNIETIKLQEKIYQALGQASMCWSEIPKGTFDSTQALQIGKELSIFIEQFIIQQIRKKKLENINKSQKR